jgi:hypothetical protein
MDYISRQALKQLRQEQQPPMVTIYIPTHKTASPPHMTEDQIRFKNLIHQAVEQLGKRPEAAAGQLSKQLCAKLDGLLQDQTFWEHQTESLLLCAAPDMLVMYHLPIDSEEYVAVNDHFHLAPILGLLNDAQEFYVLAVAQHKPTLFKGDMYDVRPTDIALPKSLEAGLNIDEMNQKSEQGRSAVGSSLNVAGSFNGRGGAKDPSQDDRLRFFRMIDHLVLDRVDRSLPLILAGIEAETTAYRSISRYPHLLQETIQGNFTGGNPHDLFEKAMAIVRKEIIEEMHHEALDRYERVRGANPERVATDTETAEAAAEQGRIDTLIISNCRYTTDTVRDNTEPVLEIAFTDPDEVNHFVNNVALQADSTSSRILNIPRGQMPDGKPLLAILRY